MIIERLFGYFTGKSATANIDGTQLKSPTTVAFERAKKPELDQALQLSSFWAAVNRWSNTIASLPIKIQIKTDDEWLDDEDHSLNKLLDYKVNRFQTRIEFMREMVFNLMACGNAYALIDKENNKIVSLLPMSATQMEIKVVQGKKIYIYESNGQKNAIAPERVWHIMLFGNNVIGMSPLEFGANSVGVGLSADERATQVLDNAAKPSGILTFNNEMKLTDKQRAQLKEEFKALKEGKDNVLMTLESGWDYKQIGMNPQDVQLLESRRFSIEDIGRFMDVPSILLNDSSASTGWGSGISQIIDGWYKLSLKPMTDYIAQSMGIHLIEPGKRRKTRIKFEFDQLLQLGRKERVEANMKEIHSGTMTPNEARELEGRPKHEDGDHLYMNSASVPLEQHLMERDANEV